MLPASGTEQWTINPGNFKIINEKIKTINVSTVVVITGIKDKINCEKESSERDLNSG